MQYQTISGNQALLTPQSIPFLSAIGIASSRNKLDYVSWWTFTFQAKIWVILSEI